MRACATIPKFKEGKGKQLNLYFVYKIIVLGLIGKIFAKIAKFYNPIIKNPGKFRGVITYIKRN